MIYTVIMAAELFSFLVETYCRQVCASKKAARNVYVAFNSLSCPAANPLPERGRERAAPEMLFKRSQLSRDDVRNVSLGSDLSKVRL